MMTLASVNSQLAPTVAWNLAITGAAIIVDVRSEEEHKFVGHVPNSVLIPLGGRN